MKKANDPRHLRRIKIVQHLFAESFTHQEKNLLPYQKKIQAIMAVRPKIDALITQVAPLFPLEKIAKIDVAILRLAIFELVFERKEPPKAIIDEAVEIAKEFGGEGSPGFVNGVLGSILNKKI